jgi:arylsulfatase A-like enzyme
MTKAIDRFQPYLILGFIYLAANIVLRCFDFFLLAPLFNVPMSAPVFFNCILNDLIWCGCVFLVFIPVYYILGNRFRNTSIIVPSLIFGSLFLIQIILVIYAYFSGKLLDKEIFMRPFSEIYTTIKSYGNILLFSLFGISIVISFSLISLAIAKKAGQYTRLLSISSTLILLISVFMIAYPYKLYGRNTQNNRFIINRAFYFIYEDINYSRKNLPTKYTDPNFLQQFASENPQWQVCDSLFPLLRPDNTPDVLSTFFDFGSKKPDIVFIVVESLGRGITGENAYSGSFTPFLDSLAVHSLYWENCVTAAQRSFSILPSLIGSLPNGNTGFQFGDMPSHTTIVHLLKENGYKTNLFYTGYYEFDNVKAFMDKQGTDYFAPYYYDYEASGFKEKEANEWGYADELLFKKSLDYIEKQHDQSLFSLFVTLTTHNDLDIPGKEKYIYSAESINKKLPQKQQKRNNSHIAHLASFVYLDNALRKFFTRYKDNPNFNNTIFVITGDHYISNFGIPDRLSLYHVPLFIYSPLLKSSGHFKSLVSVLDITPSIWSMLYHNYNLTKPQFVSWLSDGLDTAKNFHSCKKILLMQDNRDSKEFIYNNFFYSYDSVYTITDNLRLEPAPQSAFAVVSNKYNLFNTIESYVYNKNRLMPDLTQAELIK